MKPKVSKKTCMRVFEVGILNILHGYFTVTILRIVNAIQKFLRTVYFRVWGMLADSEMRLTHKKHDVVGTPRYL